MLTVRDLEGEAELFRDLFAPEIRCNQVLEGLLGIQLLRPIVCVPLVSLEMLSDRSKGILSEPSLLSVAEELFLRLCRSRCNVPVLLLVPDVFVASCGGSHSWCNEELPA